MTEPQKAETKETTWREVVEEIVAFAKRDEPVKRFVLKLQRYQDSDIVPYGVLVKSPTDALGARVYAALDAVNFGDQELREKDFASSGATEDMRRGARALYGLMILRAPVYWWRSPILQALRARPPLPTFTVSRPQFEYPTSFHCFEDETGWGNWVLFDEDDKGLLEFHSETGTGGAVNYRLCEWGDEFNENDGRSYLTRALALAAFLRSKYVAREQKGADRSSRKQSATVLPDVSVVTLRRSVSRAVAATASQDGHVSWRGRWWVSGHMRNQFYPLIQAHNPCWIAPYPKGPKDKPFLPRIFSVSR